MLNFIPIIIFIFALSCGDKAANESNETEVITNPPERAANIFFLGGTFPDYKGGWRKLTANDVTVGQINSEIVFGTPKSTINPANDAKYAVENGGLFETFPGFIFSTTKKTNLTVTLRNASKEQRIKISTFDPPVSLPEGWNDDPKVSVSLGMFSDVFPPAIRDRYELNLSAEDQNGKPIYNYTISFVVVRTEFSPQYASVKQGEGAKGLFLGATKSKFLLSTIEFSSQCEGCTLFIENVEVNFIVKKFIELPTLIDNESKKRITKPSRYQGLLVRNDVTKIENLDKNKDSYVVGQNTDKISIYVDVPAEKTLIEPWCKANNGLIVDDLKNIGDNSYRKYLKGCYINALGKNLKIYYGFVSAIPQDRNNKILGGSEGVASFIISFKGTLTTKRGGKTIEVKDISGDSGIKTPLDGEGIPAWVVDIIRDSLYSGAPEFKMPDFIRF